MVTSVLLSLVLGQSPPVTEDFTADPEVMRQELAEERQARRTLEQRVERLEATLAEQGEQARSTQELAAQGVSGLEERTSREVEVAESRAARLERVALLDDALAQTEEALEAGERGVEETLEWATTELADLSAGERGQTATETEAMVAAQGAVQHARQRLENQDLYQARFYLLTARNALGQAGQWARSEL